MQDNRIVRLETGEDLDQGAVVRTQLDVGTPGHAVAYQVNECFPFTGAFHDASGRDRKVGRDGFEGDGRRAVHSFVELPLGVG